MIQRVIIIALFLSHSVWAENLDSKSIKPVEPTTFPNSLFVNPSSNSSAIPSFIINITPPPSTNQPTSSVVSHPKKHDVDVNKGRSPTIHSKGSYEISPTPSLDIIIDKKYLHSPKIKKLYRMLGIHGSPSTIHFVDDHSLARLSHYDNIFSIELRPFMTILTYLSKAVEINSEIIKKGLVVVPRYPDRSYFNINNITRGVLSIRMSSKKPHCNVSVVVPYRNHWFYIADNDITSKITLALIEQVFNLQAGEVPQTSPVLTLPVK